MDSLSILYLVAGLVIFVALAVPGLLLLLRGRRNLAQRRLMQKWPVTPGSILSTGIQQHKQSTGRIGAFGLIQRVTVYQPVITYAYRVANREYQSSIYKISWGSPWVSPDLNQVERIVESFSAGQPVQVHYDPANPFEACLEMEKSGAGPAALVGVGIAFLAAAAVILALGINTLIQNLNQHSQTASIQASAGLLPVTTTQLKTALEKDPGLTCKSASFGGVKVAYRGWGCQPLTPGVAAQVDLWSRRDEPETVDLLWVIITRADSTRDLDFLLKIAAAAHPKADLQAVQKWLSDAIPPLGTAGSRLSTVIQGVKYTLDTSTADRINFFMGDSQ